MKRIDWLLAFLIAWAASLFFPGLGARDFWAPVEPRYAEIARVMFLKNEWIIPTVNGNLYTDKPVLYFWMVLLFSKLAGGVSEWTLRLPSAISATGLVLATYTVGKDFYSPKVGLIAAVLLATTSRILWEARWAHTDLLFTLFFTLSLHTLMKAIFHPGGSWRFLAAYALMALATLAKGLIGVVLPGLIALAFVAARREWRDLLKWRLPAGVLVFLLVAGPWLLLVGLGTDGQWPRDFLWVHHFRRYTEGAGHREPFHYYLWNLPLDLLPWTFFLPTAIASWWRRKESLKEPVNLFFFLWFAVIFLFFTLSDTKRGLYLLPAFPPVALFLARSLMERIAREASPNRFWGLIEKLFSHILWIGGLLLPVFAWFRYRQAFPASIAPSLALTLGGISTAFFQVKQKAQPMIGSLALTMLLVTVSASLWLFPVIDQVKSPRPFASAVKEAVPPSSPLYIYRDTMNDFNFYSEREVIPVLTSRSAIERALLGQKNLYLLVKENDLRALGLDREGVILREGQKGGKSWRLLLLGEGHGARKAD
jgi:4-amino-4-deoxy-L-arabinose transferase-like glycosyltransferase